MSTGFALTPVLRPLLRETALNARKQVFNIQNGKLRLIHDSLPVLQRKRVRRLMKLLFYRFSAQCLIINYCYCSGTKYVKHLRSFEPSFHNCFALAMTLYNRDLGQLKRSLVF